MNRRTFLKSIATVCGAAVVCPGELVKGKTEREILLEKFKAAFKVTKFKLPVPKGTRMIIILDEFAEPDGWVSFKGIRIPYQENLPA